MRAVYGDEGAHVRITSNLRSLGAFLTILKEYYADVWNDGGVLIRDALSNKLEGMCSVALVELLSLPVPSEIRSLLQETAWNATEYKKLASEFRSWASKVGVVGVDSNTIQKMYGEEVLPWLDRANEGVRKIAQVLRIKGGWTDGYTYAFIVDAGRTVSLVDQDTRFWFMFEDLSIGCVGESCGYGAKISLTLAQALEILYHLVKWLQ